MDKSVPQFDPAYLGKRSEEAINTIDPIPWAGGDIVVELVCSEFTSLCPITAQPDFGTIKVRFSPNKFLIETKSMKLYFWKFRQVGKFSESLIAEIADDLFGQIKPKWLEVEGSFNSRGGIAINATARREA